MRMMASVADDDFCSVTEEKFDFEVSLSPASSKGDADIEDEVFLGTVTHKEKCISDGIEMQIKDSVSSGAALGEEPSWSPMLEENFEAICKEANLLASHIERTLPNPAEVASSLPEVAEKFEMDSSAKLGLFVKPVHTLSPIKRETFCVQDSPMKQLPLAIQKQLRKVCSVGKPRLSTSSPVRTTDTQPKVAPRGNGLVASSRNLPSKPTASSRLSSCNRPALPNKARLPPPAKSCFGLNRSPGSKNASITGSAEDLLSDTTSVASDVSDSSFNTSLPMKRGLQVPNKQTELKGTRVCNAPALPNRRVVDRSRNTSSSSSSVSSINSSLSLSPGKLNSSLNTSISSINGRIPSSSSRLPGSRRKSGIIAKPLETSVGIRTSFSAYGRKSSEPLPRPVKATPIKRTGPGPSVQHQTPARKNMARTTSVPGIPLLTAKTGSTLKVNSILKALVQPTSTNSLKGVRKSEVTSSPDAPRIIKPKRLMASCSMDSVQTLALPALLGLHTPSAATEKTGHSKLRRPSALPTPVSRRVSGIPMLTPKSVPHPGGASRTPDALSPGSSTGMSHISPGQLKQLEQKQIDDQVVPTEELQPCPLVFNLEDAVDGPIACKEAGVKSPSKPSPENESCQSNLEALTSSKSEETLHNHQLSKPEVQEVLLMDVPAPVLKPQEKVLIDLSNTPDLIKTISNKAFSGQLIDLSSPLIKWSPEAKKESLVSEAPLINLSF